MALNAAKLRRAYLQRDDVLFEATIAEAETYGRCHPEIKEAYRVGWCAGKCNEARSDYCGFDEESFEEAYRQWAGLVSRKWDEAPPGFADALAELEIVMEAGKQA